MRMQDIGKTTVFSMKVTCDDDADKRPATCTKLLLDGADFTADDAVYSFKRAMMPTSAMKELLTSVKEIRKVDDHTIDMETNGANPLLINNLTNLFMMDSGWTEANNASAPQDVAAGETTFASQNTNMNVHGSNARNKVMDTNGERYE
mgnify:CR=1 FL=1